MSPRSRRGSSTNPSGRARSLAIVEAEAGRLERLVGDILDLAKLNAHRFTVLREEVGMEQVVERAYETFAEQARPRSIDFSVTVNARPVIVSDGDRVLQIVDNLLSNAFRATPDGGRIALELGQANGTVHVAVEDNGPGHRAGRARSGSSGRSSPAQGGTGLGLTIARELSHALGGEIQLDSEVGPGLALRARAAGRRRSAEPSPLRERRSGTTWACGSEGRLDPVEPLVRLFHCAGDQVDEQVQVVDAGVPLDQQVGLEPLEPPDHLVREPLDLGEPARDRRSLLAQAVAQRAADGIGQDDLELVRRLRQRLDLEPGPVERGGDARAGVSSGVHRQPTVTSPSDECKRARVRAAARADRAASARAPRRVAAARLLARDRRDPPPRLPRPARRAAGRRRWRS